MLDKCRNYEDGGGIVERTLVSIDDPQILSFLSN